MVRFIGVTIEVIVCFPFLLLGMFVGMIIGTFVGAVKFWFRHSFTKANSSNG